MRLIVLFVAKKSRLVTKIGLGGKSLHRPLRSRRKGRKEMTGMKRIRGAGGRLKAEVGEEQRSRGVLIIHLGSKKALKPFFRKPFFSFLSPVHSRPPSFSVKATCGESASSISEQSLYAFWRTD